jgi:hypothetical protein
MKKKRRPGSALHKKYPPSPPCTCDICRAYCARPGWWTVSEAARVIEAGYGERLMLEVSPERSFGVLSPAFKGNEGYFALHTFATTGCTFYHNGLCELHGTGLAPLECRFCHHERLGRGTRCHADLEKDWNSSAGQALVLKWAFLHGLVMPFRKLESV